MTGLTMATFLDEYLKDWTFDQAGIFAIGMISVIGVIIETVRGLKGHLLRVEVASMTVFQGNEKERIDIGTKEA